MTTNAIQIKKQFARQLEYFQGQIPTGNTANQIPATTVNHYHDIVNDIETKTGDDLSKYRIPDDVKWNNLNYHTNEVRDRLGSLIGYLYSSSDEGAEKEREEGSKKIFKIISLISKNFRKLFHEKPENEKAVQDNLEHLFIGAGFKCRREQVHIPYSNKTYRPDFTFDEISCAVEVKYCGDKKREKLIIDEINADIVGYKQKYDNLIFVIYDSEGSIRDTDAFKDDIGDDSVLVQIIKH